MFVIAMVLHRISVEYMLRLFGSTYTSFVTSQICWPSEILVAAVFCAEHSSLVLFVGSFVLIAGPFFQGFVSTRPALRMITLVASSL